MGLAKRGMTKETAFLMHAKGLKIKHVFLTKEIKRM